MLQGEIQSVMEKRPEYTVRERLELLRVEVEHIIYMKQYYAVNVTNEELESITKQLEQMSEDL